MNINERANCLADHLLDLEQQLGRLKQKRSQKSVIKFRLSTGWLCKRLLVSNAASARSGLRIAKDKNRYAKSRYMPEGISYDITILGVLEMLQLDGWVREIRRGSYSRDKGEGEQTLIAPTQKLLDWFIYDPITLPKILAGFEDAEPLVVQITSKRKGTNTKGKPVTIKTKKLVSYDDNPSINRMRSNLNAINDCLLRHWSDLYLSDRDWERLQESLLNDSKHDYSPIKLHRQTIRRIFNSTSFDIGGRFYGGWWQNIPSAYRGLITIDGKRTVEFDYGRLHPTILYAKRGLKLASDAYDIGIGAEHRDVVKQLFNAMIQMVEPQDRPPRDVKFSQTGKKWKQLRDLIIEKHEPIKDCFFCGMGNQLQFEDSKIAEKVILSFIKEDIPILPVHDSFLVQVGYQARLINTMSDAFLAAYGVAIDVSDSAKFLPMDFPGSDEVNVAAIVQNMDEYAAYWARNPID